MATRHMNIKKIIIFLPLVLFLTLGAELIDLNNLYPYSEMELPRYIDKNNGPEINNEQATLGRVLFYDKKLSLSNSISCASCHHQQFAFSDTSIQSVGHQGGLTGRHSMRLINVKYADELKFFWDERADSLEDQSTQPIRDHIEMGFSATQGDPDFDSLLVKLAKYNYYNELFTTAFGDNQISEHRIQLALSQFIRSIYSFDSKYDIGLSERGTTINSDFSNFSAIENLGKQLYMTSVANGGAGCQRCHRAPEFDIDPNSLNNGVITNLGDPLGIDLTNTRSPTLRDLFNPQGTLNGPLMHSGEFNSIEDVIDHYDQIPVNANNSNLDQRLNGGPGANNQILNLSQEEKDALLAFLKTLSGNLVYTAEQWSNPFDENEYLSMILDEEPTLILEESGINIHYNPSEEHIQIGFDSDDYTVRINDDLGNLFKEILSENGINTIDVSQLKTGNYSLEVIHNSNTELSYKTMLNL